ncbi:MAG: VOC family protein [Hyphomicrobiales bacterium]|nr:VOC family protein [Hyphomicrobiales bacterium]
MSSERDDSGRDSARKTGSATGARQPLKRPPVAPYLTVTPASAAIAFYIGAFGAVQKALMPALDGLRILHCELEINGGALMLADVFPEFGKTRIPVPGEPMSVSVSLEFEAGSEVDETVTRAKSLGATAETEPSNSFWGTRVAVIRDPFGHRWILNGPAGR